MNHILAIEPDTAHAEVLHQAVPGRVGARLVVVPTAAEAIIEVNRRVPDVLLIGRAISSADQDVVVAHAKSLVADVNLITIAIPELQTGEEPQRRGSRFGFRRQARSEKWDPTLFAEQIATRVAEVEARRRVEPVPAGGSVEISADSPEGGSPTVLTGSAGDEAERDVPVTGSPQAGWSMAQVDKPPTEPTALAEERGSEPPVAPAEQAANVSDLLGATIVEVQRQAEARLAEELDRIRAEAAEHRMNDLASLEREAAASREAAVREARAAAEAHAREALAEELAKVRAEAEETLASELSRVREEAERTLEQAASQTLKTEVERVRAETEARFESERGSAREEAERARLNEELDRVRAEAIEQRMKDMEALEREAAATREEAFRQARAAAEAESRAAWSAELAKARTEAEEKLVSELARVRAEAERTLEDAAAQTLKGEMERVRAETEARFEAQFREVREEAERARAAQEQARLETDAIREAAALEARTVAEQTAARELQEEVARVRAGLEAEVARFREETEQVRAAREQAQREAETLRDSAAQQVRSAAEEAAARALEAEVAKVRSQAEARLEADLAFVREQADQARVEQQQAQLAMERIHEQTLQEARSVADAMAAELARVRDMKPSEVQTLAPAGPSRSEQLAASVQAYRMLPQETEQPKGRGMLVVAALALIAAAVFAFGLPPEVESAATEWFSSLGITETAAPVEETASTPAPAPATPRRRAASRPASTEAPVQVNQSSGGGSFSVSSTIPLELYSQGQRIGTSEDRLLPLSIGQHTIGVVSERFNYRGEVPLEIHAGEAITHVFALPLAQLRVETVPGAEVWVDNELKGSAPIGVVEVPIGSREVVVKHPELGERRRSLDVRFGETTDVTLTFDDEAR